MIDPNWWPLLGGAGGMAATRAPSNGNENGKPSWFSWAHLGTTITIALFLFSQYEAAQDIRRTTAAQIAVLQEQIANLRAVDLGMREDIRSLQNELHSHENEDRRERNGPRLPER